MSTRRASVPIVVLAAAGCALAAIALVVWGPWRSEGPRRPPALTAPFPAGTSAGNIPLVGNETRVLVRWVAPRTGTIRALHLRVQADGSRCRQTARDGYGLGNGGSWHVTVHPVLADGRPDEARTLATQDMRPCDAPKRIADLPQGVARLPVRLPVERGGEYATVIRNDDPDAGRNYTSVNLLFSHPGLLGANGRNERSAAARDVYYGLDPRELVGYSKDGGRTWALPGGPYGSPPTNRNFLPAYLLEYSNGQITGQPYYDGEPHSKATRVMVFRNPRHEWTIRALAVYVSYRSKGTLTLTVDGRERARVTVAGKGMHRRRIDPVTVPVGKSATVTASGLWIMNVGADTAWALLMGLDRDTAPWRQGNSADFSQVAPVYPLPRPPA